MQIHINELKIILNTEEILEFVKKTEKEDLKVLKELLLGISDSIKAKSIPIKVIKSKTDKKIIAVLKPKICPCCETEFLPKAPAQKRCYKCKEKMKSFIVKNGKFIPKHINTIRPTKLPHLVSGKAYREPEDNPFI